MEETEYGGCGKGELRMDSQYKKLVPCIYLYRGNAVKDFRDTTVVDTDPVQLAKFYSDNSADELLVMFDYYRCVTKLLKQYLAKDNKPILAAH